MGEEVHRVLPGCTGHSKGTVRQQVRSGERVRKKKDLKISPFSRKVHRQRLSVSSLQKQHC